MAFPSDASAPSRAAPAAPRDLAEPLQIGEARVRLDSGDVELRGRRVRLQPKVAQLLAVLLESPGQVLSKETLRARVWPDAVVGDDALWRCVSDLRSAFETPDGPMPVVETLPRRGYRLVAPVTDAPLAEQPGLAKPLTEAPARPTRAARHDGSHRFGQLGAWLATVAIALAAWGSLPLAPLASSLAPEPLVVESSAEGPGPRTGEVWRGFEESRRAAATLRRQGLEPGPELTPVAFDVLSRVSTVEPPHRQLAKAAETLALRGRLRAGLELYQAAMETGDDSPRTRDALRSAMVDFERNRRSIDQLESRARASELSVDEHLALARAHRLNGDFRAALEPLQAVLRDQPRHEPALVELVRLHLALGHLPNARETLRRSLRVLPKSVALLETAAEVEILVAGRAETLDRFDRACKVWQETRETNPTPAPQLCWNAL